MHQNKLNTIIFIHRFRRLLPTLGLMFCAACSSVLAIYQTYQAVHQWNIYATQQALHTDLESRLVAQKLSVSLSQEELLYYAQALARLVPEKENITHLVQSIELLGLHTGVRIQNYSLKTDEKNTSETTISLTCVGKADAITYLLDHYMFIAGRFFTNSGFRYIVDDANRSESGLDSNDLIIQIQLKAYTQPITSSRSRTLQPRIKTLLAVLKTEDSLYQEKQKKIRESESIESQDFTPKAFLF